MNQSNLQPLSNSQVVGVAAIITRAATHAVDTMLDNGLSPNHSLVTQLKAISTAVASSQLSGVVQAQAIAQTMMDNASIATHSINRHLDTIVTVASLAQGDMTNVFIA